MSRLPIPGSDPGNWGDILNDFLSQALKADGLLRDNSVTANTLAPGAVTKSTVGLSNVDNTADSAKPVSIATQTALDAKLATTNNLSDLVAPATARTNLGLGSAATMTATGLSRDVAFTAIYDQRTYSRLKPRSSAPAIHSSPPTIGSLVDIIGNQSGTTGTAIANAIRHNVYLGSTVSTFNSARYSLEGWTPSVRNVAGHFYAQPTAPLLSGVVRNGYQPTCVDFEYYGAALEIRMYAENGFGYKLWVDDQPLTTTWVNPSITTGHVYLIPITFSGTARRKIRIEVTRQGGFGGLHIGPTDSLLSLRTTPRMQFLLVGDSYSDGANGVGPLDTYAWQLGQWLGVDTWIDGIGGTGFSATGTAPGKSEYLTRIVADTGDSRLNPALVLLQGSVNDSSGAVQSAVTAAIAQVRSQWPLAKVVVTGVMRPRDAASLVANDTACNTAIRTAALEIGGADIFIDPIADLWYAGTGRVGGATGSGNADLFMSSDLVHPSLAGHSFIAPTLMSYIISRLAT